MPIFYKNKAIIFITLLFSLLIANVTFSQIIQNANESTSVKKSTANNNCKCCECFNEESISCGCLEDINIPGKDQTFAEYKDQLLERKENVSIKEGEKISSALLKRRNLFYKALANNINCYCCQCENQDDTIECNCKKSKQRNRQDLININETSLNKENENTFEREPESISPDNNDASANSEEITYDPALTEFFPAEKIKIDTRNMSKEEKIFYEGSDLTKILYKNFKDIDYLNPYIKRNNGEE